MHVLGNYHTPVIMEKYNQNIEIKKPEDPIINEKKSNNRIQSAIQPSAK